MMSSGALPKLALSSPPITGLVLVARSSVDLPINLASGTMASAERKNSNDGRHSRQRCTYGEWDECQKRDEQIVHCVRNITYPASTPNGASSVGCRREAALASADDLFTGEELSDFLLRSIRRRPSRAPNSR